MLSWITNLPRHTKRTISIVVDLFLLPASIWLSFSLGLGLPYLPDDRSSTVIVLTSFVSIMTFVRLGLYRAVLRFAGPQLINSVFLGVILSVVAFALFGVLLQADVPTIVIVLYFGIAMLTIGGSRMAARALLNPDSSASADSVLIFGAGRTGRQLAMALNQGGEFKPIAFVDDDKQKHDTLLLGIRVFHPKHLEKLVQDYSVKTILLAFEPDTPEHRARILEIVNAFDEVKVQTPPRFSDIVAGRAQIQEVRDIKIEDLLGRDQVPPKNDLLTACVRDKVVMVTGAGGSIGSELCRQVLQEGAKTLVMLELSEYALYQIEMELNSTEDSQRLISLLGNCQDQPLLEKIMRDWRVDTVYHAAAYKHVPLVEHNVVSGALNNILGTSRAAQAALNTGVETFLLVSTDKAVRPTNFMGATKRAAELVLQDLSSRPDIATRFSMVRFGNVLGSSGSVVPLFKKQILNGGPVTITDPEVTRYFMTIPEAVQLVIQASAMAEGGDVFVLDMGKPVKIVELAQTMIQLLGKRVATELDTNGIEIIYTGLRPGEKLYEELLIGENCVETEHSMITRATEQKLSPEELSASLARLETFCKEFRSDDVMTELEGIVQGYNRSDTMFDNYQQGPLASPST